MKKRFLPVLVTIVLLAVLCMPLTAAAADGMEVTVGSLSAKQGDEIVVPITIDKNPGIWGLCWKLYYDSQVLRFDSVEFSTEGDFSKIDFFPIPKEEAKYPLVIQGTDNSVTENVTVTGVAAKVHFKVYVGVPLGETEVELKLDDPGNNINVDADYVPLKINNGVVTVKKGLTSSDNPDDYPPQEPMQEIVQHPGHVGGNDEVADDGVFDDEELDDEVSLEEIQEPIFKHSNKDAQTKSKRVKETASSGTSTVIWVAVGVLGTLIVLFSIVMVCITARRNKW